MIWISSESDENVSLRNSVFVFYCFWFTLGASYELITAVCI